MIIFCNRASQPQHSWHSGLGNSLLSYTLRDAGKAASQDLLSQQPPPRTRCNDHRVQTLLSGLGHTDTPSCELLAPQLSESGLLSLQRQEEGARQALQRDANGAGVHFASRSIKYS